MREFNLVSTPFASGVAWLVNVLLELGVRTTHVSSHYPGGYWKRGGDATEDEMSDEARELMGWHLPIVFNQPGPLRLEPGVEVFWEHRLDLARHSGRPAIVFVRDPRDAIYSIHRRDFAATRSFPAYLARADRFPDHFPGMFDLPPADTWAAWHTLWLGLQSVSPTLVVQFEALRAQPVPGVQRVLEFLGVQRSIADIERALAASTFERAREAMKLQEQKTGTVRATARRGQTGEWKETFTPETLHWFTGPARDVMARLGYAPEGLGEPWPDSATLPAPGPAVADALDQARVHWQNGRPDDTFATLSHATTLAGQFIPSRLQIAAETVACDWVLKIFGPDRASSPAAIAALNAYRGFLQRFAAWAPVQQVLAAALDTLPSPQPSPGSETLPPEPSPATGPDHAPVLVQANYRGFNLVRFRREVHAIAQALGPVHLEGLSREDWTALQNFGGILTGPDAPTVRAAVDTWCTTGQAPKPVQAATPPPPRPATPATRHARADSAFVLNFDA